MLNEEMRAKMVEELEEAKKHLVTLGSEKEDIKSYQDDLKSFPCLSGDMKLEIDALFKRLDDYYIKQIDNAKARIAYNEDALAESPMSYPLVG